MKSKEPYYYDTLSSNNCQIIGYIRLFCSFKNGMFTLADSIIS